MVDFVFDPCCGCIKLRTSCLIIGYFRLAAEITLYSYMGVKSIPSWADEVSRLPGPFKYFMTLVGVLILLFMALSILACILLLVGLHKNQHEYVSWYAKHAQRCIFITLAFFIQKLFWPQDVVLFRNSFILSIAVLQCYFLLVIHCYCKSIGEKPQPATTAAAPAPAPAPESVLAPASPPVPHK